jgi:phosphinothricin acetyltransferase
MSVREPAGSITTAVRPARAADLLRLTEIYNHYILTTAITFDIDLVTVDERRAWFDQFSTGGRHRLFVAEQGGVVRGYAGSHQFRTKKAYDPTVETTVYCAPEATGRGLGTLLYRAIFDALGGEDIHLAVAGITLPNDASIALHERFGFTSAGVMRQVGRKFDRYWDVAWYEKLL